jgi:hypothetical protein
MMILSGSTILVAVTSLEGLYSIGQDLEEQLYL